MKRGKNLTKAEKKMIDTLSKNKLTHDQIAKEIDRPQSTKPIVEKEANAERKFKCLNV